MEIERTITSLELKIGRVYNRSISYKELGPCHYRPYEKLYSVQCDVIRNIRRGFNLTRLKLFNRIQNGENPVTKSGDFIEENGVGKPR